MSMKKKRDYEIGQVFALGRGLFKVQFADGKYFRKNEYCTNCCFSISRKACNILACHSSDRKDGKEVVFEIM